MPRRRLVWILAAGVGLLVLAAGIGRLVAGGGKSVVTRHFNTHAMALETRAEGHQGMRGQRGSREAGEHKGSGAAQEAYDNRAYPRKYVTYKQVRANQRAFRSTPGWARYAARTGLTAVRSPVWQELGPWTPYVPAPSTYTGRATTVSGRVQAMAIGPTCVPDDCTLYVAAGGGGVWKTTDALSESPFWEPKSFGMLSNSMGALAIDPNHPNVIWAGTGEPSGSSDSEAGIGLYRSGNGGDTWTLIPSSVPITKDRAIGTIAVDPTNSNHILIGTDVARHGSSSVNGGRFTPPGAPHVAVFESFNNGLTWKKVLELPADTVNPDSANGSDFFAGGITKILFDPNLNGRVYASSFAWGLFRRVGTGPFQQILHAVNPGDTFERAEFALAKMPGGKTRIWAGSGDFSDPCCAAELWRVDDASKTAASLLATQDAPTGLPTSWKKLSDSTVGTAGYTAYDFCQNQCSYDIGVWSPPNGPSNIVVLQGAMRYDDIFGGPPISNGGTVVRSTNSGASFSDMTNDTLDPPTGLHPDHRSVAFSPDNPNIMFLGSDGGVDRVGPVYVDKSKECDSRPLTAEQTASCRFFLKAVPHRIISLDDGLRTLQFQSVTISKKSPGIDLIGGTQDNGTWAFNCRFGPPCDTFETINGDGGQSAIDSTTPTTRTHSYFNPYYDTNFHGNAPFGWDWISDPFLIALGNGELFSFYPPLIQDPVQHGYEFTGGQHVYRTPNNGGPQASLDAHCNEYFGDFPAGYICGNWVSISDNLTAGSADEKGTGFIAAIERALNNNATMWVGTRRGRIFVTRNAKAAPSSVVYDRIDTTKQPRRFPSGISIDPKSANHAFISFSGYNAYTPTTPGHVFEVTYHPATHDATWVDRSYDLGDQPITDIEYVAEQGALYAATDFGVVFLPEGSTHWYQAGRGLPMGAVYGLRQIVGSGWLYAATHGRGVWRLPVQPGFVTGAKR